jgi:hypothetical protein
MERLLLLWDELDEVVGMGRHLVAGALHGLACRRSAAAVRLQALYASAAWSFQRAAGRAQPVDKL